MNILLIGNGFDLAHGLPTKYTDFLEFVKAVKQIINKGNLSGIDWEKIDEKVIPYLKFNKGNARKDLIAQSENWKKLIDNNIWIEYFLQNNIHGKENWIDFESEISEVIQSVNEDIFNGVNQKDLYSNIMGLHNKFLNNRFTNNVSQYLQATPEEQEKVKKSDISYKELRDIMVSDLNKFIRAFEIYLSEYVERMKIKVISLDIKEIVAKSYEDNGQKRAIFTKVLSFNYTSTYEKMYLKGYDVNVDDFIDYIHGKADINNSIETNNMVLGIDEYLEDDQRNKDVAFIAFKKFYQRIYKETGCKYKEWVNKIQGDYLEYVQKQTEADRRERKYIPDNMQAAM